MTGRTNIPARGPGTGPRAAAPDTNPTNTGTPKEPASVLVVDDSAADRTLIRIAFQQTGFRIQLRFAASGKEALDVLRAADQPRPAMCVIDVKMPGLSGLEVLRVIKLDPGLAMIPVVMISGSDAESDIAAARAAHASGYITKPSDAAGLARMTETLKSFCKSYVGST